LVEQRLEDIIKNEVLALEVLKNLLREKGDKASWV